MEVVWAERSFILRKNEEMNLKKVLNNLESFTHRRARYSMVLYPLGVSERS